MAVKTTANTSSFVACGLLSLWWGGAGAAELLSFEFDRTGSRYTVNSESYIDVPPEGVFEVLSDYTGFHRISSLVVESRELGPGPEGEQRVFTKNSGCLGFFCRSISKVEALRTEPPLEITTTVIPEQSDVAFGHSQWRLAREGRGTHLIYSTATQINFWVPPMIGNYLLERWLRKGAKNALTNLEYYAWHTLYGDSEEEPEQEPDPE